MIKNIFDEAVEWQKVQQGDQRAFACLFNQYWEEMFARAYRRLKDEDACREIVQKIFIHCWEHRQQIEVKESIAAYLFTALKYSIIRHIWRVAKKGTTVLPLSPEQISDEALSSEEQEYEQLISKVYQEIDTMPHRMRQIFLLNKQESLSAREIALRLSISEQTVKNQLHTAIKRLRVRLRDHASFLPFIL